MFRFNKTAMISSLVAGISLFTGCAALDEPIHTRYVSEDCTLENMTASSEPYHLRFEVVSDSNGALPGMVELERTTTLDAGQESMVFSGEATNLEHGIYEDSQIWVLASLGENANGNLCLKTRTATRPSGLESQQAVSKTVLTEEIYDIEMVGACGESFLETAIPGVDNASLRISTAPKSTAEYLSNPESAVNSSCAQVVESLSPSEGQQFTNDLRNALGV